MIHQTPNQRESAPADLRTDDDVERIMSELIQQAEPEQRAELNDKTPEQRRALVQAYQEQCQDPDSEPLNFDVAKEKPTKLLGRKL